MIYTLKYTPQGGEPIEFSVESGFVVGRFTDPNSLDIDMTASNSADGIGAKLETQVVQPKIMTISGTIVGNAAQKRRMLTRAFAPMVPGVLSFNGQYEIDCYPKTTPAIEAYLHNPAFQLVLYAPYPYWRDSDGKIANLIALEKRFRFPWNISSTYRFSAVTDAAYINVYNTGTVPSRWRAEFYARTELQNPKFENILTGEFVRIIRNMEAGERIIVDATGPELSVIGYTADNEQYDAFIYLDIDSNPFSLRTGDNLLKASADVNMGGLSVSLTYSTYVSGVYA